MADIEDIEDAFTAGADPVRVGPTGVARKSVKLGKRSAKGTNLAVPGAASVHIKTWGCSHNQSDSEYMAGLLTQYGYNMVKSPEDADCVVLNSCTVKNPSQDHFINLVKEYTAVGKPVVAAGCVSQGEPDNKFLKGVSIIGTQQIDRVVEVVEQSLAGNAVRLLGQRTRPSLDLPKIRRNPRVEILTINTGCLNACTYCKTKHARGKLGSYEPEVLVQRVKDAVSEGVCEIWLTSEDTGAYGRDIGTNIAELLWKLVEVSFP